MTTVTFDTLQFANRLKAAGVPCAHAEAEASALAEVFAGQGDRLATKQDVDALGHRIDLIEVATKQDFAQLGARIEQCETATKQEFVRLEARIEQSETAAKQDFARLEARIEQSETAAKQEFARLEVQIEQRATKADLTALEARTKDEMGRVEERLEAKIEKSALRLHGEIIALSHQIGLLRWMMGLIVAGVTSLIVKAFIFPGV
ncbi:MAG: hypothetical protein JO171_06600 [Paludibacterium sp.]|uniref:hypothetical protein n=1 Tax=Paludibacterium sp. TaxID=1917523 RepID=UPI0025F3AFDF|nr:hypothetical protein [Paludibacterium sp.]MBV8046802.1 hypothetical protein [Paludibacterium sp.]